MTSEEMHIDSIEAIVARLKLLLNTKLIKVVAYELGIHPNYLSNCLSREYVPLQPMVKFARENGISIDWLLTGDDQWKNDQRTSG